MTPQDYKRCPRCDEEKPLNGFHRDRARKDGRQSRCKECHIAAVRASQVRYPEKEAQRVRRWRLKNPEGEAAISRRYKDRNQEVLAERARVYREQNAPKIAAQQILNKARRRGEVVAPDACQRCETVPDSGVDGRTLIQAHHADYTKPLEVEWLCPRCHGEVHFGRT